MHWWWSRSVADVLDSLDAIAEFWLGYAHPPPRRAVVDAGWRADAIDDWCRRCGVSAGSAECDERGCAACRDRRLPWARLVRLGAYAPPLSGWVTALKYEGWSAVGGHLGRELGRQVRRAGALATTAPIVVPVPMPWIRRADRGLDHAETIAAGVAAVIDAPMRRALRHRAGVPQAALPSAARRRRRAARFAPGRHRTAVRGVEIVLVDDVCTTGATLRACARHLRRLGAARVVAAVVAVADPPDRDAAGVGEAARGARNGSENGLHGTLPKFSGSTSRPVDRP